MEIVEVNLGIGYGRFGGIGERCCSCWDKDCTGFWI